ncbi:hypothetical protein ACT2CR_00355 [Candidatus Vidania fulgoroideorum]
MSSILIFHKKVNFLSIKDFKIKDYKKIYDIFVNTKYKNIIKNKNILLLFSLPSTRTRLSFDVGITENKGNLYFIEEKNTQISRGENLKDTANILNNLFDLIIIRCFNHKKLEILSKYLKIPLINALTFKEHPCQILNDIFTYIKSNGKIKNKNICWIGTWNNVINSWYKAASIFKFKLFISIPNKKKNKKYIKFINISKLNIKKIDILITDVWNSMGETNKQKLSNKYKITTKLLNKMHKKAVFMHCLPAHDEIEPKVLYHKKSIVWQCALNKKKTQISLIKYLLSCV